MEILISNIRFVIREEETLDGAKAVFQGDQVEIEYTASGNGSYVDGSLEILLDEYEEMKLFDVKEKVDEHVKGIANAK